MSISLRCHWSVPLAALDYSRLHSRGSAWLSGFRFPNRRVADGRSGVRVGLLSTPCQGPASFPFGPRPADPFRRRGLMKPIARLLSLHPEAGQYRTADEPFVVVATA